LSELKKTGGTAENLVAIVKNVHKVLKKNKYGQEPQVEGNPSIITKPFLK